MWMIYYDILLEYTRHVAILCNNNHQPCVDTFDSTRVSCSNECTFVNTASVYKHSANNLQVYACC